MVDHRERCVPPPELLGRDERIEAFGRTLRRRGDTYGAWSPAFRADTSFASLRAASRPAHSPADHAATVGTPPSGPQNEARVAWVIAAMHLQLPQGLPCAVRLDRL